MAFSDARTHPDQCLRRAQAVNGESGVYREGYPASTTAAPTMATDDLVTQGQSRGLSWGGTMEWDEAWGQTFPDRGGGPRVTDEESGDSDMIP